TAEIHRRFDWPAFLVIRKRAGQSDLRPQLFGAALNVRNRITASLQHPPSLPRESVPLPDSVADAQCSWPRQSEGDLQPIAFLLSLNRLVLKRRRSFPLPRRTRSSRSPIGRIIGNASNRTCGTVVWHEFRRKNAPRRPILFA